jgi:hypothetical protein
MPATVGGGRDRGQGNTLAPDRCCSGMTGTASAPEPRLYLLQGAPAVGKLTLAREIERRTGAIVVDNHLVNNAVFVPLGMGRGGEVALEDTDALRARVLDVVLEATLAASASLSHVFTNWLPEDPGNHAHVGRLRDLAARRGARVVPVWMSASAEAPMERVASPGRAERSKLVDPMILSELLTRPELPAPQDAVLLDLSTTAPSEAAEQLLTHLA